MYKHVFLLYQNNQLKLNQVSTHTGTCYKTNTKNKSNNNLAKSFDQFNSILQNIKNVFYLYLLIFCFSHMSHPYANSYFHTNTTRAYCVSFTLKKMYIMLWVSATVRRRINSTCPHPSITQRAAAAEWRLDSVAPRNSEDLMSDPWQWYAPSLSLSLSLCSTAETSVTD